MSEQESNSGRVTGYVDLLAERKELAKIYGNDLFETMSNFAGFENWMRSKYSDRKLFKQFLIKKFRECIAEYQSKQTA